MVEMARGLLLLATAFIKSESAGVSAPHPTGMLRNGAETADPSDSCRWDCQSGLDAPSACGGLTPPQLEEDLGVLTDGFAVCQHPKPLVCENRGSLTGIIFRRIQVLQDAFIRGDIFHLTGTGVEELARG
jgi:hypothetical protein